MSKKISKKLKEDLANKIEWEGGLVGAIEHGAVLKMAKGTTLEKPFADLAKALEKANEALDKEGICE